jgi:hypothetical protein
MESRPTSDMLKGLKNKAPSAEDSSTMLPKGPSVSSEATRSEVATNAPTLGPRTA